MKVNTVSFNLNHRVGENLDVENIEDRAAVKFMTLGEEGEVLFPVNPPEGVTLLPERLGLLLIGEGADDDALLRLEGAVESDFALGIGKAGDWIRHSSPPIEVLQVCEEEGFFGASGDNVFEVSLLDKLFFGFRIR